MRLGISEEQKALMGWNANVCAQFSLTSQQVDTALAVNPPLLKIKCYKCGAIIEAYYYGRAMQRKCPSCRTLNMFDDTVKIGVNKFPRRKGVKCEGEKQ